MFRNRQSQKPSDELYKDFKANFPTLNQAFSSASGSAQVLTSLADALDVPLPTRHLDAQTHDLKDAEPTPRASNEAWNFGGSGLTPSMMDPNSHSFNLFANQLPGYYTPTPGGTNTLYHPQAGDLHTPGFGMGLGTPLSMPTSEGALHAGQQAAVFQQFHHHLPHHQLHQPLFHNVNPFQVHQQSAFPPHHFTHQAPFETLEGPIGETPPVQDGAMDVHMVSGSPPMQFRPQTLPQPMHSALVHPTGDKFRYHATLNAPTAMIKHTDEIPITYLNKGQAYTLSVIDTHMPQPSGPLKYRTFVRVSFEDEQQRQKPASCWQLWKEGRGTNEAHQRGGRLQAVEYVDSGQMGNAEDPSKPRIELESSSFDGFCVQWSPPMGTSECAISVRFNFLSTDFSHSKGVKGIPVRLCAKTEILEGSAATSSSSISSEVCYGKVKLFRDHGAERKLANDVAHVKKSIDKVNQQIVQIESGMKDLGKRKRASVARVSTGDDRPGKVAKHRRTWSLSSVTSTDRRGSAEEDLHIKLATLQDMFSSTRPMSVLYLRGDSEDDPDNFPVRLSGEALDLTRTNTADSSGWEQQSAQTGPPSSLVSPSPSSQSLSGLGGTRRDSNLQQPTPIGGPSRENSDEFAKIQQTISSMPPPMPQQLASPPENQSLKVQTLSPSSGPDPTWIDAIGVDPNYQPPPPPVVKPVACFYIRPQVTARLPGDAYYRAVYVMQRTLADFVNAIASKSEVDSTKIHRTIRINNQGLQISVDDETVRELPEGQDMIAEFTETQPDAPVKFSREWDAGATDLEVDEADEIIDSTVATGYELRLRF